MSFAVSIIIPHLPSRPELLSEAVGSIRGQVGDTSVDIIVGLDPGAELPSYLGYGVETVEGANQSAKVNAGVAKAHYRRVAILHDDDLWHPEFLGHALGALEEVDFVSSTALQTDEEGRVIGIIDCPVPSGWVFWKKLFERVGPWREENRFHPDSEWLGRLGETPEVKRVHLIEALAPDAKIKIGGEWRYNPLVQRPGMLSFLQQARPAPALLRHGHAVPLVNHRQKGDGIMQRINEPERWMASQWEYQRMTERFGHIPW